ncbi:MAG: alpha/beta fold hydrolase [Actinobacteria bacterium]|nr:alpha/beta fold hydrolase [Actinomycetota bacterium]
MRLYREEHGDGPPLLLLTGLGYAIWSWQRQIPAWSESFRTIAVDNRGTGRSPKPPGPYSIEEMADDAAEALDGRRAHVAGFSMGGYIAQTLALRHPDLVEKLVLVCTATGGPNHLPTPAETISTWEAYADRTPPEFARASMPLSFAPGWTDEHPDEFEHLLADRLEHPTPPECWRAQYDACWRFIERVSPVEEIAAPTLVVHGDADRIVPYENGVELARRIPGARFERLARDGHLLFLESPDHFNTVVCSFLSD